MAHWAWVDPDFIALRSGGTSYTYGEFEKITENMATALLAAGVGPGSVIATILPASPEYIMALIAADKIGAVITALDVKYKTADLKRFISHVRPKVILSLTENKDFNFEKSLLQITRELGLQDEITLYMIGENTVHHAFDSLYQPVAGQQARLNEIKASQTPDDGLLVIFTGGTTGVPKSAMLNKENVRAMAEAESQVISGAMKEFGIKERIKSIACLPPSHVGGSVEMICSAIVAGNEIIIHDVWSPKRFLATIEKEQIPWIGGVPTMYAIMLLLPELASFDLSCLKLAILSGEKVELELLKNIQSKICPNIMVGYGSTEAGSEVTFTRLTDSFEEIANGYVGFPLKGADIRISDENGRVLPAGEKGEVQVRGELTIKSYFNMPNEDAAGFTPDGYCRTGDLGLLNKEGQLYILGRLKHVIRVGSYTVMPSEVEEVALAHPTVGVAAAIGVPDDVYGEVVWLVVAPAAGQNPDPQKLICHCESRLAKFKVPQKVIVDPDIPVTRIGKVHRVEIQKRIIHLLKGSA